MKNSSKTYDFVIIGSGIGGLVTALILAKNGFSVCVLEKNQQLGGALQTFSRNKRIFDTGVHYLGGLDKGENLYQLFSYLEILDELQLKRLDDAFDYIRLANGKTIPLGQGYEKYIQILSDIFPQETAAIHAFTEKIQEICTYFPLYNIATSAPKTYHTHPDILAISASDFIDGITKSQELKAAFLGNGLLYAFDKNRTPLHVVALILNSYIKGSYRIENGGSQLTKALVKKIRHYNGELLKRKEVVKTIVNAEKKITQVVCQDGSSYQATTFISNLHPVVTMDLVGKQHLMPATVQRIASLKNSIASFVVNISLKEGVFPYHNSNYYDFFTPDAWETVEYDKNQWPQLLFSCTPPSSKSATFADTFTSMTYIHWQEFEQWKQTHNSIVAPAERDASYQQFKNELAQKVVQRLIERFPQLENAIEEVHCSTPLTFRDYLGNLEGEMYGIEKDFNNPIKTIINPKTKISNLYLTGQNIVFHGILGATIGAFVTSFNFVDANKIINSIKE